jgi:hypothetical protein
MAYDPTFKNKYRVSRAYNKASTEAQRKGKEEYGWTDGKCLDPSQAEAVAANYRRAGLAFKMTIKQKIQYTRFLGQTSIPGQETTLYARPAENTVPSALQALQERKERFISGGNSSTGNEITEEGDICIKIYLTGRSKDQDKVDYQERMAWLIQHYGSKSAVEKATGIPRRTQTRILQGRLER